MDEKEIGSDLIEMDPYQFDAIWHLIDIFNISYNKYVANIIPWMEIDEAIIYCSVFNIRHLHDE